MIHKNGTMVMNEAKADDDQQNNGTMIIKNETMIMNSKAVRGSACGITTMLPLSHDFALCPRCLSAKPAL